MTAKALLDSGANLNVFKTRNASATVTSDWMASLAARYEQISAESRYICNSNTLDRVGESAHELPTTLYVRSVTNVTNA